MDDELRKILEMNENECRGNYISKKPEISQNVSNLLTRLIEEQTITNSKLTELNNALSPSVIIQRFDSGIQTLTNVISSTPSYDDVSTTGYTRLQVNSVLSRNAPKLFIINLGPGDLYIRSSRNGDSFTEQESVIYEGGVKVFYDVFEVRLRTPLANTQYIATEFDTDTGRTNVSKSEKISIIETDKDTHFTGLISQWNHEEENLTGLTDDRIFVRGVNIQSDQNLKFRLIFWTKDTFANTNLNDDSYIDDVILDMSDAENTFRINNANQYYLNVSDLNILYEDEDETNELHISLQNLSPIDKAAGATGEVQLDIKYAPRL